jgi:hypothetical protein
MHGILPNSAKTWIWIAVISVAGVHGAHASSSGGSSQAPQGLGTSWAEDPKRVECGQSCLLEKANENLALQARFVTHKLEKMQERVRLLKTQTDSQGKPVPVFLNTELYSEYKLYCTREEQASDDESKRKQCFLRYQEDQLRFLSDVRKAMIANNSEVAKINKIPVTQAGIQSSNQGGAKTPGAPDRFALQSSAAQAKVVAQVPHVLGWKEMAAAYDREPLESPEKDWKLSALTSEQFQEWLKQLPKKPEQTDFLKSVQVKRYPEREVSETFTVYLQDEEGKPVYDQEAYQKAKRDYEKQMRLLGLVPDKNGNPSLPSSWKDPVKAGKEFRDDQLTQARARAKDPTRRNPDRPQGPVGSQSISKEAFLEARMELVNGASRAMAKMGIGGSRVAPKLPAAKAIQPYPKDQRARSKRSAGSGSASGSGTSGSGKGELKVTSPELAGKSESGSMTSAQDTGQIVRGGNKKESVESREDFQEEAQAQAIDQPGVANSVFVDLDSAAMEKEIARLRENAIE